MIFSLSAHVLALGLLISLPLIYGETLPVDQMLTYFAPPPKLEAPPAPPRLPQLARDPNQPVVVRPAPFQIPTEKPDGIPDPPNEDLPGLASLAGAGNPLGVAAGVPGGDPGISSGPIAVAPAQTAAPPPPPPRQREPLRVSIGVQSSKLIRKVEPVYPPLAVRARVEGVVLLQAKIDVQGRVADIQVVSGHPLLKQAALEAVRQWIYSPTLLNGEPVEVMTSITVNFRLAR